ncbi:hypothetical protein [Streptomyces sp. NPDC092307]|uniref:hypothetical protein n=1 Tax=Streptomyces sp. NPDC092307 TaxID=3366013 RepID=UPI003820004A
MALLEFAIKTMGKGAIGKLRQRSLSQVPNYEPYPALERWTWRPAGEGEHRFALPGHGVESAPERRFNRGRDRTHGGALFGFS